MRVSVCLKDFVELDANYLGTRVNYRYFLHIDVGSHFESLFLYFRLACDFIMNNYPLS